MANKVGEPDWPTTMSARLSGGRLIGTDRSVWLYRSVPMGPVVDAANPILGYQVAEPILAAFEELAGIITTRISRRSASRSAYRKVHILLVNVPRYYRAPEDHPISSYLQSAYRNQVSDRRVLLFGVRLLDKVGGSGGFQAAVASVAETLATGMTPLSDYDVDYAAVDAGLGRAGLTTPSDEDIRLANAWWNHGRYPDTPLLVHGDHLHVFTDSMAAAVAADIEDQKCRDWPTIPGHHAVTFAAVQDFDLPFVSAADQSAHWVPPLLSSGVRAMSIRGLIEPAHITRYELRRQRKRNTEDINEFAAAGKMERAEQSEKLAQLEEVEAAYALGGPPTLVDASIVVGIDGQVDDITEIGRRSGVNLHTMDFRQQPAMFETMLCSPIRANPHLHDLPAQTVACSGLPSLSMVGDKDGALVGFTEQDRQAAYLSPTAASSADGLPIFVGIGQTGSGKLVTNVTQIPTPSGWTRMGDLKTGDSVFGRDGRPCSVEQIFENPLPELYDVHLSDGQVIRACVDHQWVVSTWQDRNGVHHPHRVQAIENHHQAQKTIDELVLLAEQYTDSDELTDEELLVALADAGIDAPWKSPSWLSQSLDFVDCPSGWSTREIDVKRQVTRVVKNDPAVLFPVAATIGACRDRWANTRGTNAVRWADQIASRIAAADILLSDVDHGDEATTPEIARRLEAAGAVKTKPSLIARYAREAGIESRTGRTDVVIPLPKTHPCNKRRRVWSAPIAFKHLAIRLSQTYQVAPSDRAAERILTTGEMLAAGVKYRGSQSNFAIRVTDPLELPTVNLAVDPYILGAWLGDGSTGAGALTQGTTETCTDEHGLTDQAHLMAILDGRGYQPRVRPDGKTVGTSGLRTDLRHAGVLNDKHIPMSYLRASQAQRLALLQGLMDTDGTIDTKGACELSLCNERLASDALELIRSLGIKAAMSSGPATITEDDPDHPGQKRRRTTSTRYRINFTTTMRVFRLPRKAERLPTAVRETQEWLYVTDITPAPSEPGRCITVNSPDHTYLIEGFVPTHNTMALLNLADQFARMGTPVVVVDPKVGSDHGPAVSASDGQVVSLDAIAAADGVFDPLRFAISPEAGIDMASSLLLNVNPWGSMRSDYEAPLNVAIAYGVHQNAGCIGDALKIAERAGKADPEMVAAAFALAESSPMFRACFGIEPGTTPLRLAERITLIKVGNAHLDLPEPGVPISEMSLNQRVALALVKMMVFGSAMALTGRRGVVMLDEAWVFLGSGRAEVERLGRLARSQGVLPMLFTQRVTDALDAGLAGYISRGLILPITDEDEARAACELFKLEPTPERMSRLTAKATMGAVGDEGGAPNWRSMRALRDPETGQILRGSIGIYADLFGRAVPVEVRIPEEFLEIASTNPDDIRRRKAAEQLALGVGEGTEDPIGALHAGPEH